MSSPAVILTSEILAKHGSRSDLRLWPNLVAKAWVGQEKGRTGAGNVVLHLGAKRVKVGLPEGSADLIGITDKGQFISIEIKAGKDTVKPNQRKWMKMVLSMGGIAGIARSVQDVTDLLGEPPQR